MHLCALNEETYFSTKTATFNCVSTRDISPRNLFIMTFSSQWETNPYKNSKLISLFLHSDFRLITTPGYIRFETFRSTYAIKSFCFVWWFFFLYFENIILQPSTYFSFWWFLFEMKKKYHCIDIKASIPKVKRTPLLLWVVLALLWCLLLHIGFPNGTMKPKNLHGFRKVDNLQIQD